MRRPFSTISRTGRRSGPPRPAVRSTAVAHRLVVRRAGRRPRHRRRRGAASPRWRRRAGQRRAAAPRPRRPSRPPKRRITVWTVTSARRQRSSSSVASLGGVLPEQRLRRVEDALGGRPRPRPGVTGPACRRLRPCARVSARDDERASGVRAGQRRGGDRAPRRAGGDHRARHLVLLRAAGLGPGMRVLDLGTGLGHVALAVARLVGDRGSVVAIDQAEPLLAVAERRRAEAGLDRVRLRPRRRAHVPRRGALRRGRHAPAAVPPPRRRGRSCATTSARSGRAACSWPSTSTSARRAPTRRSSS